MLKGLTEMKDEMEQALLEDLGRDKFVTELCEIGMLQGSAKWDLKNVDWMAADRPEQTELIFQPGQAITHYEPLGVCGIFGTWNYPYTVCFKPLIQCITSGNCAILKPSEMAPASSAVMKKFVDKYLDNDAFQVVEGAVEVAVALNKLKVDLFCFTGSTQVGKIVAQQAAKNMVPCIMELGGKCPAVINHDANMDATVAKICFGRFNNSGQTCIAPDYVLCHYKVINEFVEKLQKKALAMYGNSKEGSPEMGKMINEFHAKRVQDLIKTAGGQVAFGGNVNVEAKYCEPTVIMEPEKTADIMTQEIFGPILPVYPI
jgi:aldehyde dehydrogenase (NAD+)